MPTTCSWCGLGAAGSADRRRRDDGLGAARRRGRGGRPERAARRASAVRRRRSRSRQPARLLDGPGRGPPARPERLRETLVDLQQSAGGLGASEARFRALLEAHPNAVLAVDEDGLIKGTCSTAEMFGYGAGHRRATDRRPGRCPEADVAARLRGQRRRSPPRDERPSCGGRRDLPGRGRDQPILELEGRPSQLAVISDVTWRQEADQVRYGSSGRALARKPSPRSAPSTVAPRSSRSGR